MPIKYCLPADRRFRILKRELFTVYGRVCMRCNVRRATELHHWDYSMLGWENHTGCELLCHACHRVRHGFSAEPANDNQLILDLTDAQPANDNEKVAFEIAADAGRRGRR